ncbi:hypothetical protein V5799_008842 [Amblyomma americanum]|uniref:Uncharacterized protein n=1 Tax=Amblyomma americanum TaxID=6943 RepID=A0AAQ4FC40_AMBAM
MALAKETSYDEEARTSRNAPDCLEWLRGALAPEGSNPQSSKRRQAGNKVARETWSPPQQHRKRRKNSTTLPCADDFVADSCSVVLFLLIKPCGHLYSFSNQEESKFRTLETDYFVECCMESQASSQVRFLSFSINNADASSSPSDSNG